MKADEHRSPIKHVLEHEVPVVIHNPEEDMNQLRRWLYHAQENPAKFWGGVALIALVLFGLSFLSNGLSLGRASRDEAWAELETAKTAAERVEIAKTHKGTPASAWAMLQAGTEFYNQGFVELPSNKDLALPTLKKALEQFQAVAEMAEPDSTQARAAILGMARTYEARNELDKAIAQYQKVSANKLWAATEEGKFAEKQARLLKTPEAVAFYKDLYAFKAPTAEIPAGGKTDLNFPLNSLIPPPGVSMPGSVPGASTIPFTLPSPSPTTTPPATEKGVEPNPLTVPPPPAAPATKAGDIPADPFASKPEAKAGTPAPSGEKK